MITTHNHHSPQIRVAGLSFVLVILLSVFALALTSVEGVQAGRLYEPDAAEVWVAADGACEGMPVGGTCVTTIQAGIDAVDAGGTVRVLAGEYPEFVEVNKSVTLRGPQFGADPRSTGVNPRVGGEALVIPPSCSNYSEVYKNLFNVTADNVVIDGFTIDGNNPALESDPSCGTYTSDSVRLFTGGGIGNGTFDVGFGTTYQPNAVTIRHNILQNFNLYGVALGSADYTGRGNHSIYRNVIDNLLGALVQSDFPYGSVWGVRRGIYVRGNQYGSVKENLITRTQAGIDLNEFNNETVGSTFEITGNDITSVRNGIWVGRIQNIAIPLVVTNNELRTHLLTPGNPATSNNIALLVEVVRETAQVAISGNHIHENANAGIQLFSNLGTNGVTVQNTTIASPVRAGVELINQSDQSGALGPMHVTLDNVDITGGPTGILVNDNAIAPASATLNITVSNGSSVVGGPESSVGLRIGGPDAAATVTGSSFSGGVVGILATDGGVLSGVNNSFISGGGSHGIQLVASAGQPGKINHNNLADSGGDAINNATTFAVDASANWWGTADVATVAAEAGANVDYTPWLNDGADTNAGTAGFQGNYAWLWVDDLTNNTQTSWIGEGLGYAAEAGKVSTLAGTYNESVTLDLNKTLSLEGDMTITGGINQALGTIVAPNGTLTLQGSFVRSGGVFTHNSGAVALTGSSSQTLGGAATVFDDLILDNGAGVNLGGPVTVNGTLTLNGAVFDLGVRTLTLGPAASVAGEAISDTNLVVADSGAFCKQFSANGGFSFPIGDNSGAVNRSPVVVNLAGAGATYTNASVCGVVQDGFYPGNAAVNKISRYWTLTASGISGATGSLSFSYSTDAEDVGSANESKITGLRFVSGSSTPTLGSSMDASANMFGFSNLNTLSAVYTAGNPPPTLTDMVVAVNRLSSSSNRISWTVTGAGPSLRYQVLRSFSETGTPIAISPPITGAGPQFSYDDQGLPLFSSYYYWLSVLDQGSGYEYVYGPYQVQWLRLLLPLLFR